MVIEDAAMENDIMAEDISAVTNANIAVPLQKKDKLLEVEAEVRLSRSFMRVGDLVMLRLPSTAIKQITISENGTVSLGKYGSFASNKLIGKPYGDTYEIVGDDLQVLNLNVPLNEIVETQATNEHIASHGTQNLSFEEIEALRSKGASGREIIKRQVEEHSAFDLKTEFSKDKYLKRKEAKFLPMFTPIEPTIHSVCDYNLEKESRKIKELRPDTLSQMMALANVRPGGRLMIVDDTQGLVVAAAVERMAGDGRIMIVNDIDSPPDLHLLDFFNFDPEYLAPLNSIHWAEAEEDYAAPELPIETPQPLPPLKIGGKPSNLREIQKVRKRKAIYEKVQAMRDEYFSGDYDAVVLACDYEPFSILQKVLPRLAGSASIVVYSPYLELLHSCRERMKLAPDFLSPSIHEPFLRKYQVLPGRTHPEMNGLPHGGYLLTSTRVFENDDANSYASGLRAIRRRKAEEKLKLQCVE